MDLKLLKHIYHRSKPVHLHVFLSVLFFVFGMVAVQFKPLVTKSLIDTAVAGNPVGRFILYFAILLFVTSAFFRTEDYFTMRGQMKVQKIFYDYGLGRLIQHSYSFFTNNFSGSLVAKLKRYSNAFEGLQDVFLYNILNAVVSIIAVSIILFFQNFWLAIIFIIWAIVYSIASVLLTKKQRALDVEYWKEDSKTTGLMADIIANILTIKMFAKEVFEHRKFKSQTSRQQKKLWTEWKYLFKVFTTQSFLLAFLEFFLLWFSITYYQKGIISLGTIVLVQLYAVMIFGAVWNLGRGFQKITRLLSEMKEMVDIIEQPPEVIDIPKPESSKIKKGEIVFENVTFAYEKDILFKNFNLRIKAGEKVGLVGKSGSGKTSITKLLLRFFNLKKGRILIDGQDISKIKQADLRQAITYVPQEPLLFHRTIKENIAYAAKSSDKELFGAAKKAFADKFINTLPKKYNTLVGERGVKLSGGERQRIAIARAILKKSPIVVMDEATSSLDTLSEKYIQKSMKNLLEGRTAIVIAHRLSTVKELDRIIVLDNGGVVEEGSHRSLLKKKGAYYELYKHQQL